jgi:hypothetical protein
LRIPPPGVQPDVQVWRQGNEGPGYSLGYDFRRGTIVGSLPNGTYSVHVVSSGSTPMEGVTNITVGGAPVSGTVVTLQSSGSIAVNVTEEFQHAREKSSMQVTLGNGPTFTASGHRPNYLQVSLVPVEEFGFRRGFSLSPPTGPEDDALVMENVMPGSYRVQADSGVGYVAEVTSGGTDLLKLPLVVGFGAAPPPIEVIVRDDGGTVEGTVVRSGNGEGAVAVGGTAAAQQSGAVYFFPVNEDGRLKQAPFFADGHFQMTQLRPGSYRVLAFEHPQNELEYANEEMMSKYGSWTQVVNVAAGQTEQLRLTMITGVE